MPLILTPLHKHGYLEYVHPFQLTSGMAYSNVVRVLVSEVEKVYQAPQAYLYYLHDIMLCIPKALPISKQWIWYLIAFMVLKRKKPALLLPTYLAIYLYIYTSIQSRKTSVHDRSSGENVNKIPHSQIHLPTNIDGNTRSLTYSTNSGIYLITPSPCAKG